MDTRLNVAVSLSNKLAGVFAEQKVRVVVAHGVSRVGWGGVERSGVWGFGPGNDEPVLSEGGR